MVPELAQLFASAAACARCPGMGCRPVLSAANGPTGSRVLFVGEAPGRLGAGRTGVPFSGDMAGRRFEALLAAAGLNREEVFVTNAVLCLPLDARGRNRPPAAREIGSCGPWLSETLRVLSPRLVVGMGSTALRALRAVAPHALVVGSAGSEPQVWNGMRLAAVYHPAARSQVHRPWASQLSDWQRLGAWIRANL